MGFRVQSSSLLFEVYITQCVHVHIHIQSLAQVDDHSKCGHFNLSSPLKFILFLHSVLITLKSNER